MTWLAWRQHRGQLCLGAALLAALAALLLATGLQMASQYQSAVAAEEQRVRQVRAAVARGAGSHAVGFLVIMTVGAPVLTGLFWGAPLVAGELETGTSQFVWMQSVTRRRWLTVKAGWMLLAAAVWGGVISGLVTWWSGPDNALQLDAFKPGRFDIMGVVPVGYALFAMALGICAGAVLRRTLPAMAVTLAGFLLVRAAVALWLRPHYMSAVTVNYPLLRGYVPTGSYWQVAQGILDPNGRLVPAPNGEEAFGIPIGSLPAACQALARGASGVTPACRAALSGFHGFVTYQPAGRYWAFQGIEFGIFAVLAAALIAIAAVVLLRRDV